LTRRLRTVWSRFLDDERAFWVRHLVRGGPADRTAGRQATLARLLRKTAAQRDFGLTQRSVRRLAREAEREDEKLAQDLLDIAASESVLAIADALFGYLQTLDGRPVATAADTIRCRWPRRLAIVNRERFAALRKELEIAGGNGRVANEWLELSSDLAEGRWSDSIQRLFMINKLVMEGRGGPPWVVEEGGTFRVRYRDEEGALPGRDELADLWRYPYFIDSLRLVTRELGAA
jgi:hypothetical protein